MATREKSPEIDVLLICALKDEYDQVLQVTDGIQSKWESTTQDNWIVSDAIFSDHKDQTFRIRATYSSHMGREKTLALASTLTSTSKVRCIAMSGICAGWREKLFLGDVIFADRLWSYDAGKIMTDDKGNVSFHGDPIQYQPSNGWTQRMQHLAGSFSVTGECLAIRPQLSLEEQENWVLNCCLNKAVPEKQPDFDIACPDWASVVERLWQRGWLRQGKLALTKTGSQYIKQLNMLNPRGLPSSPDFKICIGGMATGAAVVEDSKLFPRIAESSRKILGIEMEASALGALGMHNNIPVLIAKGVSDYGDEFKDDRYREFAARASAECLIALLRAGSDLLLEQKSNGTAPKKKNPKKNSNAQHAESSVHINVPVEHSDAQSEQSSISKDDNNKLVQIDRYKGNRDVCHDFLNLPLSKQKEIATNLGLLKPSEIIAPYNCFIKMIEEATKNNKTMQMLADEISKLAVP